MTTVIPHAVRAMMELTTEEIKLTVLPQTNVRQQENRLWE